MNLEDQGFPFFDKLKTVQNMIHIPLYKDKSIFVVEIKIY